MLKDSRAQLTEEEEESQIGDDEVSQKMALKQSQPKKQIEKIQIFRPAKAQLQG